MEFIYLLLGFAGLYFGADFLILGGASLALRLGVSTMAIGLTIMGYGTGMPELAVSLEAGLWGKGDISLGNVIGSNIANIGLVLGLGALLKPFKVNQRLGAFDGFFLIGATVFLSALCANGQVIRLFGFVLLFLLILYTVWALRSGKRVEQDQIRELSPHSFAKDLFFLAAGFLLLVAGGHFFLKGAVEVARFAGLSDAVIGLTLVAVGTSLPEMATAVLMLFRNHEDMAVGNIVGSNIFNICAIVGLTAAVSPITIEGIGWVDFVMLNGFTLALVGLLTLRLRIGRLDGAALLAGYLAYMAYLFVE